MATFLRMAGGGLVNADAIERIEQRSMTETGRPQIIAEIVDGSGAVELADSMDYLTRLLCPNDAWIVAEITLDAMK